MPADFEPGARPADFKPADFEPADFEPDARPAGFETADFEPDARPADFEPAVRRNRAAEQMAPPHQMTDGSAASADITAQTAPPHQNIH